jgi:hypothetical protein
MDSAVFTNATNYKLLICTLKKAGCASPPTYDEVIRLLEGQGETSLLSWIERQEDRDQLEDMLLLQWEA